MKTSNVKVHVLFVLLFLLLSKQNIFAQGLIGIGTTTPTAQLHTTGSVRLAGITNNNTYDSVLVRDPNGNIFYRNALTIGTANDWHITGNASTGVSNFLGTTDNNKLSIRTNNLERLTVLANGRVGIGTTIPKALFHLTDAAGTGTMLFPYEVAVIEKAGDLKFGLYNSTSTGVGEIGATSISFGYSKFTDFNGLHPGYEIQYARNDTSNYLRFNTLNRDANGLVTASPQANHMVLDDYGRVGINLGATGGAAPIMPTANLHVNGTVRFEKITNNNTYQNILVSDDNGNLFYRSASTLGSVGWSITGNAGTVASNFLGTTDNNKLSIRTNNLERITVLENGRMGIGTTTPKALFHLTDAAGTGTMLFPYEVAVIEKAGDLKFGLYNSTSTGVGEIGATSISFGYSKFTDLNGLHPGYEIQYARNDTSNYLRFNTLNRDANGFVTASPQANHMVLDDYGRMGINLGATGGAAPVMPTANLHINGTVRFQNLPVGGGFYLTVDENGNVRKSTNSVASKLAVENMQVSEEQILKLNEEISALKAEMILLQEQITELLKSKNVK